VNVALLILLAVVVIAPGVWFLFFRNPAAIPHLVPIELTEAQRATAAILRRDAVMLGATIGERNVFRHEGLEAAATHVAQELVAAGYEVRGQIHETYGVECANLEAEIAGTERASEIVVVGAHYDSVMGSPGGNDNGSGVAVLLALARRFAGSKPARTIRFVFFVNEEPPFFQTGNMGSLVYARRSKQRGEDVRAMIAFDAVGYFSDEPGSQEYPAPIGAIYPSTGNFVAFVSNLASRTLLARMVAVFDRAVPLQAESAALPDAVPGIGWSDHWSFWKMGYPAVLITDTAVYRDPHYHTAGDKPERLDYDRMALLVDGAAAIVEDLAK
jgi:hypothetical protein